MAVDTRDKRASALLSRLLPLPDGLVLSALDRVHVAGLYRMTVAALFVLPDILKASTRAAVASKTTSAAVLRKSTKQVVASKPTTAVVGQKSTRQVVKDKTTGSP